MPSVALEALERRNESWFEHRKKSMLREIFHSGEISYKNEKYAYKWNILFDFLGCVRQHEPYPLHALALKATTNTFGEHRGAVFCHPILVVGKVCKGMVDGASRTGIEMHLGILL